MHTGLLIAHEVEAEVEEPKSAWTGKGEFGFVKTTGNTEAEALNMGLEFIYEKLKWRHRLGATALRTKDSGVVDAERYTFDAQSDYKFSEKSYMFGALRWDSDRFAGYDPVATLTTGYGRQLLRTEKHFLDGEIGGGFRSQEVADTGEKEEDLIARIRIDYRWLITPSTEFGNQFLTETGKNNTFIQNDTNLTVAINKAFALKLAFQYRNNTDPPPGDTEKTDTQFTTNLVYNF
jgi:putative salt-induced outer membrane protein